MALFIEFNYIHEENSKHPNVPATSIHMNGRGAAGRKNSLKIGVQVYDLVLNTNGFGLYAA